MVVEQQEHCSASHTYLFRHFCAGSLWHDFSEEAKQHYIQKLTSVCSLSKMFDAESKVLHLNYRSHENIFCETFGMENLASRDLSFDCIANMNGRNVGVGLKTLVILLRKLPSSIPCHTYFMAKMMKSLC